MQLKKLNPEFYTANVHLKEALDNFDGKWQEGKIRGYGVVIISIKSLVFAIPLRSNIKHKAAYFTLRKHTNAGLDYSKALLIENTDHISNELFKIPQEQHIKLLNKSHFIRLSFEKYVEKYTKSVIEQDENILNSNEYRYTTLKNYHKELFPCA
jgi:protein AbiQ